MVHSFFRRLFSFGARAHHEDARIQPKAPLGEPGVFGAISGVYSWIAQRPWALALSSLILAVGLAAIGSWPGSESRAESTADSQPEAIDTLIPKGQVLVPIEVQNFESLDSVLGKYGVVDLYLSSADGRPSRSAVAYGVKILRAPRNPNHFAVLVADNQAHRFAEGSGAYFAIVQNPNEAGTRFEKQKVSNPRRRILYEGE